MILTINKYAVHIEYISDGKMHVRWAFGDFRVTTSNIVLVQCTFHMENIV